MFGSSHYVALATTSILVATAGVALPVGRPDSITRVNVSTSGAQADTFSFSNHSVSATGRWVAFDTGAALAANDTNGVDDVFLRDVRDKTTDRISVSSSGVQGDGPSRSPSISADGRYVAFVSEAHNLIDGETSTAPSGIFVRDRVAGTTIDVTRTTTGAPPNGVSDDPEISGDGRYVTFASYAANLVPGDHNSATDIFVHDLSARITTRVSVSTGGEQADDGSFEPAINRNGRYLTFISSATTLVAAGDTNQAPDVYVRDMRAGTTTRVSVTPTGSEPNGFGNYQPDITADGRLITFMSAASDLVPGDTNDTTDIFVRDMITQTTTLVSVTSSGVPSNDSSEHPVISADGRRIAFGGWATNLVAGDTNQFLDVFVRDLRAGTTTLISTSSTGEQGDSYSGYPAIDADGDRVTFRSWATNLVPGDTNGAPDVFLHAQG
jgi:Tol biopolymer transport system component